MKNICKDCEHRTITPNCHDSCEKYRKASFANDVRRLCDAKAGRMDIINSPQFYIQKKKGWAKL